MADGTNVGKTAKIVNITFGLVNEGLKTTTASGQYSLGLGEIEDENYETLKPWFTMIVKELDELKNQMLLINEKEFKLEFYFTADLKLMLNVLGLKQASSSYPCPWCETPSDELHILDPERSIINTSKLARTETGYYGKMEKGYKNESLLGGLIPFHRCVVDSLHMKIRIVFNVLIQQLILELIYQDNFKINQKLDEEKHQNIVSYLNFLKRIKIKVKFVPHSEQGKTSLHRDLNGTEISRFLESILLNDIYPRKINIQQTEAEIEREMEIIQKRDNLQQLFESFFIVHSGITNENPLT